MAVSIPLGQILAIEDLIYTGTSLGTQDAALLTGLIVNMIRNAANESLDQATAQSRIISQSVRTDVTGSLNVMSDILSDQIFDLSTYINNTMLPALTAITEASSGVTDEVAADITKAYDAIAESQTVAGKSIQDTIITMGESVEKTYNTVGEWIHDTTGELYGSINNTIESIMSVPSSLIDYAVEHLIPAEMQALRGAVDEVLEGGGMRSWLGTLSIKISDAISSAFTFEEEDIKKWSLKIGKLMEEQLRITTP